MRAAALLDPANWRVALWTVRAGRRARRGLSPGGKSLAVLPRPPALSDGLRSRVVATLSRTGVTCLERAAVLQAWDAAHGRRRDVVVGVTKPSSGFRAHAWLDGEDTSHDSDFTELLRLPARRPPGLP